MELGTKLGSFGWRGRGEFGREGGVIKSKSLRDQGTTIEKDKSDSKDRHLTFHIRRRRDICLDAQWKGKKKAKQKIFSRVTLMVGERKILLKGSRYKVLRCSRVYEVSLPQYEHSV